MKAAADRFFDTNVLLYLLSGDARKADRAEALVSEGGTVSVQVLNEFASVSTRKLGLSIAEAVEVLAAVRASCRVVPVDEPTHDLGLALAQRHELSLYDAFIAAAAMLTRCKILLSEDLQHGMRFEGGLRVLNPFR